MKSIYSLEALQRIVDHVGIGVIEDVSFFTVSRGVWRHLIETNQGEFELYSFPILSEMDELFSKIREDQLQRGIVFSRLIHSFDRHHKLIHFSKKIQITPQQLAQDLPLLKGQVIIEIFRVYGTILQMEFSDKSCLYSYGTWNLQRTVQNQESEVLLSSSFNSYAEIDEIIDSLAEKKLTFQKYILRESWFELYFSGGYSLHFQPAETFPAAEMNIAARKNWIKVYGENEIYYVKETNRGIMRRKLFLTSNAYMALDLIKEYLPKSPSELRVAFIPTAADPYENKDFVKQDREALVKMGLTVTDLDLKVTRHQALKKALENFDIIFMAGGNTFYLLDWVRKSGFDQMIKPFLDQGVIYIGSSAGSVLCCPTIEGVRLFDDPAIVPDLNDFSGLGLFDQLIFPHAQKEKYATRLQQATTEMQQKGYKTLTLNDDQAVIVSGNKSKILTQPKS